MNCEQNQIRPVSDAVNSWRPGRVGTRRVLLREPEMCAECGSVFLSLYPIRRCNDHDGLEKI